jgi:hypothetical protein
MLPYKVQMTNQTGPTYWLLTPLSTQHGTISYHLPTLPSDTYDSCITLHLPAILLSYSFMVLSTMSWLLPSLVLLLEWSIMMVTII